MANEPHFEVYPRRKAELRASENADAEFGWRFRAANGQISAIGGEGFTRREDAHRAVKDFLQAILDDPHDFASSEKPFPPIRDVDE